MVKMGIFGLISYQNLRLTISTMENLDLGYGHGRNFDHLTIVISKFWPWSWSKIFDHMTMTPARRPYGQTRIAPPLLCLRQALKISIYDYIPKSHQIYVELFLNCYDAIISITVSQ